MTIPGDSLSRCHKADHLYDFRPHVAVGSRRQNFTSEPLKESMTKHFDHRIHEGKRSEQDLRIERIRQGDVIVLQLSFLRALGKLGKWGFIGLGLPPYLMMYLFPKWVLLTVLPAMTQFFSKQMRLLRKKVFEFSQKIISQLTTIIENLRTWVQRVSQSVINKGEQLFQSMKDRVLQGIIAPLLRSVKMVQSFGRRLSETFRDGKNKTAEVIQQATQMLMRVPTNFYRQLRTVSMHAVNGLKNRFFAVLEKFAKVRRGLNQGFEFLRGRMKHAGRVVQEHLSEIFRQASHIAMPIVEWAASRYQSLASMTQQTIQVIQQWTNQYIQLASHHIQQYFMNPLKAMYGRVQDIINNRVIKLTVNLFKWAISSFMFWKSYRRSYSKLSEKMKKMRQVLRKNWEQGKQWCFQGYCSSKDALRKGAKRLKDYLRLAWKTTLKTLPKLKNLLKTLLFKLLIGLKNGIVISFSAIALFISWSITFFLYGIILLKESSNSLVEGVVNLPAGKKVNRSMFLEDVSE